MKRAKVVFTAVLIACIPNILIAQATTDLSKYNDPPSRLRGVIEKFDEDYGILNRLNSA